MRADLYAAAKQHCDEHDIAVCRLVTRLLEKHLRDAGRPNTLADRAAMLRTRIAHMQEELDAIEIHMRHGRRRPTGWPPPRPMFGNMDQRGDKYGGSGHLL